MCINSVIVRIINVLVPISDAGYILTAVACFQVPYWMMQAAFMQKGDDCTRVSLLRLPLANRKRKPVFIQKK